MGIRGFFNRGGERSEPPKEEMPEKQVSEKTTEANMVLREMLDIQLDSESEEQDVRIIGLWSKLKERLALLVRYETAQPESLDEADKNLLKAARVALPALDGLIKQVNEHRKSWQIHNEIPLPSSLLIRTNK